MHNFTPSQSLETTLPARRGPMGSSVVDSGRHRSSCLALTTAPTRNRCPPGQLHDCLGFATGGKGTAFYLRIAGALEVKGLILFCPSLLKMDNGPWMEMIVFFYTPFSSRFCPCLFYFLFSPWLPGFRSRFADLFGDT